MHGYISGKVPRFSAPVSFAKWKVFQIFYVTLILGAFIEMIFAKNYVSNPDARTCICDGEFDQSVDYFPFKSVPNYSKLWNVSYHKYYKIITYQTAGITQQMILKMCGSTPTPPNPNNLAVVEVPIFTAGFDSTTTLHMFEYIGQRKSATFYNSDIQYIVNPCYQLLADQNYIKDTNDVQLQNASIDLYLISKYGFQYNPSSTTYHPTFVIDAVNELTPLGRSEWVELLATFFNREQAAKDIADNIEARYECYSSAAVSELIKPKVVMFDFSTYFISGKTNADCSNITNYGLNILGNNTLNAKFIRDAGGDLIPKENFPNTTFLGWSEIIKGVDIVIYSNDYTAIPQKCQDEIDAAFMNSPAYTNNKVFDIFGTGSDAGTDYFEGLIAQPDIFLLDLIAVIHPNKAPANYDIKYLRRAVGPNKENMTILGPQSCTNPDEPLYNEWTEEPCAVDSGLVVIPGLQDVDPDDSCDTSSQPSSGVVSCVSLFLSLMLLVVIF